MNTVNQILDQKGRTVFTIEPDASVYDAIAMMADKQIGALPVMEGDKLIVLITERDYARKGFLQGRSSPDTKVREIMSDRVMVVPPELTTEECMALMTEKRIRHLPVVEDGDLVGVVSIGDMVKAIISEQRFTIEQLEHYISS
ncbi:MAG: CBS domain-containing protein [Gammaproteobacteria bacterium]|nr:CBS domain-containing protein [Gammaproteobacteria bacterium]